MASPADKGVRLNKYLASCGVGSRRGCEEYITQGRVEINGKIVLDLSSRVREGDHVKYDGKMLRQDPPLTLILSKPWARGPEAGPGVQCPATGPVPRVWTQGPRPRDRAWDPWLKPMACARAPGPGPRPEGWPCDRVQSLGPGPQQETSEKETTKNKPTTTPPWKGM